MNIYILKIDEKYFKKIIKYHINIIKINKKDKYYYLYLDTNNYNKIKKFKKLYNFEIIGYKGFLKYKLLFKKKFLFFLIFFLNIIFLIFLSNIVFSISIKTNDKELSNLIIKELEKNNLKKYRFVKSYLEKEKIRTNILENNKDKIEWLEITRIGSKYVVNVEKRIIKNIIDDDKPRDVVASKNAILLSIKAVDGSIVKKLNDYIKKGEVVVTGKIMHKDSVVDLVRANALIYGETWYTVHVTYPIFYYENVYTGVSKKRLSLTLFNKKFNFFDYSKYDNEEITEKKLIYHKFLPFKLSYEDVKSMKKIDDVLTPYEAYLKAVEVAKSKIIKSLPEDSKILDQKKLKFAVNNSTIDVDIFFKVYENITSYQEILEDNEN